jgi:hypothetical protein
MNGEPQGNYVSVNGREMYYEDRGAGPSSRCSEDG